MPELPDIVVYIECLRLRIVGQCLDGVRIASPFLVRTYDPPLPALQGKRILEIRRMGKRIILCFEDEFFLILHLMIAGRLHWRPRGTKMPTKAGLAAFDFNTGTLLLTEAGSKRRASLYLVRGEDALRQIDPGGIEVLEADLGAFRASLVKENHTLKRALADPRIFSGIGNAYSDEILHRARLSPLKRTDQITAEEVARLHRAAQEILISWTERLRQDAGTNFPERVTAFRPGMAVHGRYREPCPDCGTPVQRITYAENETNYCPSCQTGGKLLADRSLSRLLKSDWPRSLEELEERKKTALHSARSTRGSL
jgi:formamidopyrimidine-DNA glycosylase